MKTAIGLAPFHDETEIGEAIELAGRSGFDAVELTLAGQGPFSFTTPQDDCRRLAARIREAGLDVSAVSLGSSVEPAFAAQDAAVSPAACERTVVALDVARWIGTDVIIITPNDLLEPGSPASPVGYADRWASALEAMVALREDTEQRAVRIACHHLPGGFLLSPLEARAFIDQVNSPWIGLCLNVGATMCYGHPQDWLRTLGHRVTHIYFTDVKLQYEQNTASIVAGASAAHAPLGDGDVDWQAVRTAIRDVRYEGPATCIASAPSPDAHRRLESIIG